MKVIDLLNKIANGEETPELIEYHNRILNKKDKMLVCKENIIYKLDQLEIFLNDEVEIIEEPKKIEKLTFKKKVNNPVSKKMMYKINEIIDYINKKEE